MRIDRAMWTEDTFDEISKRFRQYRIAYPMTQAELAEKSLVSLSTIKRFENGEDISLSKLIMLLSALGLQGHLEMLIPDQSVQPLSFVDDYRPRQRARKKKTERIDWKWGDEE